MHRRRAVPLAPASAAQERSARRFVRDRRLREGPGCKRSPALPTRGAAQRHRRLDSRPAIDSEADGRIRRSWLVSSPLPRGASTPAKAPKAAVVTRGARTAATDEISLFAAKYRISFADKRQSYASETGRLPAYFFLRRPFLAVRPLRAASALSIANSLSLRPCLMRAVSHRGRAPRPAQVSPPGPRYLGATLRPFSAERRPNTVREIPAAWPLSARSRESCFSSSLRF